MKLCNRVASLAGEQARDPRSSTRASTSPADWSGLQEVPQAAWIEITTETASQPPHSPGLL